MIIDKSIKQKTEKNCIGAGQKNNIYINIRSIEIKRDGKKLKYLIR